ncbi:MAG: hypothetical protein PVJ76_15925 [Gemmatimonadota bacterium]|jgi:hypothetical protein
MLSRKRAADLFVEGVVIVISILLAFALEAWWAERGERLEEAGILENLQVEFTAAGAQLDRYLFYHEVTLTSVDSILDSAREALDEGRSRIDIPTIFLARAFIPPTYDPQTGTLDGLTHSGHFGVLRSEELRKALSAWPGLLAEAAEEDDRSAALVYSRMDPLLSTMLDISEARMMAAEVLDEACANVFFGRSCEDQKVEIDLPPKWAGSTSLPVNFEVIGLFSARYQILEHGIDDYGEVREEIDRIVALVEGSLAE